MREEGEGGRESRDFATLVFHKIIIFLEVNCSFLTYSQVNVLYVQKS